MGVFASISTALARAFSVRSSSSALALVPAEPPRLGEGGPTVGQVMRAPQPRRQLVRRLAIDADVASAVGIFARADTGATWDLQDLIEDTRDLDSRLDAVSRVRMLAIQSRPWVVTPPEGWEQDRTAKLYAERIGIILREMRVRRPDGTCAGFRSQIVHLAHGALNGYAVSEQDWARDSRGWIVPRLEERHVNRFGFDERLRMGFLPADRTGQMFLCPLEQYPDRFVVHSPLAGRSSYPWRRGALRTRILPSLGKRGAGRWWLTLLERWGQPQVFVNVQDGEVSTVITQINEAFQALSDEWQAIFPEGVRPETIDKSGTVSSDLHARYLEVANTEDAIAVLGQNLTTEVQGGSFAATEAHRAVQGTILAADLEELSESITQQTVVPTCRFNGWTDAPSPVFKILSTERTPWTVEDVREGVCTPDEYREMKGATALADGAGAKLRTPMAQVPVQLGFGNDASGGAPPSRPFSLTPPSDPSRSARVMSQTSQSMAVKPSETSSRSTHPLASVLSNRSGESM